MKNSTNILKQIGKPNLKYLGKGMQSVVFALDSENILKVYGDDIGIGNILRLKSFYESLDVREVSFNTPYISNVKTINGKILVTEKRLQGACPDTAYLQKLSRKNLKQYLSRYLDTLFEVQNIKTDFLDPFEPLDISGKFFEYKEYKSWGELLIYNLTKKYHKLEKVFTAKIRDADYIFNQIKKKLRGLKILEPKLIHGDFFPANTMIDVNYSINAVLDFGILTTIGDPVFDIALGWIFSDMYEEVKTLDIKGYLEPQIFERITEEEKERVFLYILIYSFISANMYETNDSTDGHFQWCIHNLNNKDLLIKAGIYKY